MRDKLTIWAEMRAIFDRCKAEGERDLTLEESRAYNRLEDELEIAVATERRATFDQRSAPIRDLRMLPGYEGATAPTGNALTRSQRLTDRAKLTPEQRGLSFGKYIKGIVTGEWSDAAEERTLSIGTSSAGGYLVPTPLAANVIDLARNQSRVMQAGALTVPMEASTLKMARVASDPTSAWYAESTQVADSGPTLELLTFTAKTMACLVTFSRQLFEDVDSLDALLSGMFAEVMGLKLDAAALYGGDSNGPSGLIAQSVSTTSMGTNGAALQDYDPFIDAIYAVENANFEPNAVIYAPRTQQAVSKLKDDNSNPLTQPAAVAALQKLVTKQVPINRTQGTASNASDAFVGQWDQALIGMRTDFNVQVLTERYADYLEIGLLAYLRADIQFARLAAFNAIVGIIPPA